MYKTSTSKDVYLENLVWNGKECVLVSNVGDIFKTIDGTKVTNITNDALSSPFSVAWNGETYVMVGYGGTIATYKPIDIVKVKIDYNGSSHYW